MDEEIYSTLDVYTAAFLKMKGFYPSLRYRNRRVVFEFPSTPELHATMDKFSRGEKVKANEYAQGIKDLKGRIFSMKDEKENEEGRIQNAKRSFTR